MQLVLAGYLIEGTARLLGKKPVHDLNNVKFSDTSHDAPMLKLGISACLLGEKVRYDGGHKLDHYLAETLGAFVDWVPVCPEVETGLGIPREPMRLVGTANKWRLMTRHTQIDHTDKMLGWAQKRLQELSHENLCGFVFKSRSPSSGLRVKVYNEAGIPGPVGAGIWAKAFTDANPLLPVADEGRLRDAAIRENFIERVFVYHRWQAMAMSRPSLGRLVAFHADHKYLIMAHSPAHLRQLGRIVSGSEILRMDKPAIELPASGTTAAGELPARQLYAAYLPLLMAALQMRAT